MRDAGEVGVIPRDEEAKHAVEAGGGVVLDGSVAAFSREVGGHYSVWNLCESHFERGVWWIDLIGMQAPRDKPPTFFALAVQQRGCANRVLDIIACEVDFTEAEGRVAAIYSHGRRPAVRVGVLLRVMILRDLYGLSDPQAEVQLRDRLSFQKFVQLDTREAVPDESTILPLPPAAHSVWIARGTAGPAQHSTSRSAPASAR